MNKRLLLILIIAAGALLLAVIILFIVAQVQAPKSIDSTVTTNEDILPLNTAPTTTDSTGTVVTPDTTTPVITDATVDDVTSITRLARNFTERYTSYSTDTHYENIEKSRSMMTADLSIEADKIIANSQQDDADFYSVSTQVTNVTLTDFVEGATGATGVVAARQTVTNGQADPTYKNRTARLTLKKDGLTWKVDSFLWQ